MPPQLGIHRTTENTMPSVCAQSGRAVKCRWWGPAQIYMKINDQKWMIESL